VVFVKVFGVGLRVVDLDHSVDLEAVHVQLLILDELVD
jgi:hypothetical protein